MAHLLQNEPNVIKALSFSGIITILVSSLIILNAYKVQKLIYSNFYITLNNEGIRKYIDIDNSSKLTGLNKYNWEKTKRISPQNISINWDNIDFCEENAEGFLIKIKNMSSFFTINQLIIPKEIESYETIKNIINSKLQNSKTL
jgi:hypothetical protein